MKTKPKDTLYCSVRKDVIDKAEPVLDPKSLRYLYAFIRRRYAVHLKKDVLKESKPWTKDQVIQNYRFTNVRREHDKETRWLIDNISKNTDLRYADRILNTILFRCYNKHETMELIGAPFRIDSEWNPEHYRSVFEAHEVISKTPLFTGVFYTTGMRNALRKEYGEEDSAVAVLKMIKSCYEDGFVDMVISAKDQQEVFDVLKSLPGIGDFLAYQMFVDLTYMDRFLFSENEFVVAGPGCRNGLKHLFKDPDGMTFEECLFWLRDNIDRLFVEVLGKDWNPKRIFWDLPLEDRYMNVMSLENCFCELSKYIRAKEGTGKPKSRYPGS